MAVLVLRFSKSNNLLSDAAGVVFSMVTIAALLESFPKAVLPVLNVSIVGLVPATTAVPSSRKSVLPLAFTRSVTFWYAVPLEK